MAERFNTSAFYDALDSIRQSKGITWKDVAVESEVNASTLTRMGQGKRPDIDGLAALLAWSKLKAEMFIPELEKQQIEPIAKISSILRTDRSLSSNSAKIMEDIIITTYKNLKNE